MKKHFIQFLFAGLALLIAGCSEADRFEYGKEVVLITGTDSSPLAKTRIVADVVPCSYTFTVSATGKVTKDTKVGLKIDGDAVADYNARNRTSYVAVPSEALSLSSSSVTIPKDSYVSESAVVSLTSNSFMEDGVVYVIPVSIDYVEGDMEMLEASKSIFIKLGKTHQSYALDIKDTGLYSTYNFGSNSYDLTTWTLEIKAYPYNLKSKGAEQLCRLCCWMEDGGGQVLLRLNENGKPWKTLDIVSVNGRYTTGASGDDADGVGNFVENEWQLISIVWDGTQMKVYVNGELDSPWFNSIAGEQSISINRFEIGMSWGGYGSSQSYTGRMAEMRIWNRARSQSEISETQCSVDVSSEGLLGYWRFNEGSGHIFRDTATWTKDGGEKTVFNDMDWSKSQRDFEAKDPPVYSANSGAASSVYWVKDDKNNCLQ